MKSNDINSSRLSMAIVPLNTQLTRIFLLLLFSLSLITCEKESSSFSNGNADKKLIGTWQASSAEIYVFHADGKFDHFSATSHTEGTFTSADGKIHFKNIVYEKGETWEEQYPDAIYEYEHGKDADGEYLKIANFLYGVTYVDISTAYMFRK